MCGEFRIRPLWIQQVALPCNVQEFDRVEFRCFSGRYCIVSEVEQKAAILRHSPLDRKFRLRVSMYI